MKNIKFKPFVSRGEPIMLEDGTVHTTAVQIFETRNGLKWIRIGRTVLKFFEDGRFDGVEFNLMANSEQPMKVLKETLGNHLKSPLTSYFEKGTENFEDETISWPKRSDS